MKIRRLTSLGLKELITYCFKPKMSIVYMLKQSHSNNSFPVVYSVMLIHLVTATSANNEPDMDSPITLTSDTKVYVKGKRCVLRVDPQSKTLVAYPVKPETGTSSCNNFCF
jgi:hypothetical protein